MKISQDEFEYRINEMIQKLKGVTSNDEVILAIGPKIKMPETLEEALRHKDDRLDGLEVAIAADKPFLVATTSGLINQCIKAFNLTNAPSVVKVLFIKMLIGLTEEGINPDNVDISELTDLLKNPKP